MPRARHKLLSPIENEGNLDAFPALDLYHTNHQAFHTHLTK
ncbi:MAG TPA: hypothetical protein PLX97_03280 [Gemmatales bacterium]|nr:hypothetical protein [Gemmatales bacterium]